MAFVGKLIKDFDDHKHENDDDDAVIVIVVGYLLWYLVQLWNNMKSVNICLGGFSYYR